MRTMYIEHTFPSWKANIPELEAFSFFQNLPVNPQPHHAAAAVGAHMCEDRLLYVYLYYTLHALGVADVRACCACWGLTDNFWKNCRVYLWIDEKLLLSKCVCAVTSRSRSNECKKMSIIFHSFFFLPYNNYRIAAGAMQTAKNVSSIILYCLLATHLILNENMLAVNLTWAHRGPTGPSENVIADWIVWRIDFVCKQ